MSTYKTCTGCKLEKGIEDFYRDKSKPDGRYIRCKSCHNEEQRRWREKIAAQYSQPLPTTRHACQKCGEEKLSSEFYAQKGSKTGLARWCKTCSADNNHKWRKSPQGQQKSAEYREAYYEANYESVRKKQIERNRLLRRYALEVYSGPNPICACCGETEEMFLSIDHINGNGSEHRRTLTVSIYRWLQKNGYPDGFRVLCHNCNFVRGHYGYCPHNPDDRSPVKARPRKFQ